MDYVLVGAELLPLTLIALFVLRITTPRTH